MAILTGALRMSVQLKPLSDRPCPSTAAMVRFPSDQGRGLPV